GTGYSSAQVSSDFNQQLSDNLNQYIGFSLSIPIFNNFRTKIAVRKARISYENALVNERQSENNLSKIINQAVLDLRAAEKSYNSTRQAFQANQEAFDVLKQRYDVGLANSIELSTSQTNMNKAEFDFIQARYNLIFRTKVIDYYLGKPITFN
ncbi:TolC family protein, partial [Albibacterium sp.]|uniref:TolC family protein n=1 Tax=Albibacterium sp. TaxID=2952885 RepID=UPI002C450141